jgi:hypothetical protein
LTSALDAVSKVALSKEQLSTLKGAQIAHALREARLQCLTRLSH